MTNLPPDRLDRLEATLTRFAELQIQNSLRHDQAIASLEEQTRQNSLAIASLEEQTRQNSLAIASLEEQTRQNSLAIASLEEQTRQNSLAIAQLTERVNTLSAEMTHLVGAIANYIVESEADREIIKQNQVEIRRIWEYLFRQNPNGRGEG